MSTNSSRKRRNENNERVDDDDDDDDDDVCIQNEDVHVNGTNVNDSNDKSCIEANPLNIKNNVKNTNDDEEGKGTVYRKDEEYDIHNYKKGESKNNSMINYAEIFTELVHQKESSTIILEFLDQHPIATQQLNSDGDYPLHVACQFKQFENDVILLKLIDLYKIAVTKPNVGGYYPLHIACHCIQFENAIMKLIEIFPEAASISLDWPGNPPGKILPLHFACGSSKSDTVIRKLIELNPKGLEQKAGDNLYPFNYALGGNQSSEIIQYILNDSMINYAEFFEDVSPYDFHTFIKKYPIAAQQRDHNGDYLLHVACRDPAYGLLTCNVIMKLIKLYAIAVTQSDKDGFYPVHIACRSGQSNNVIVKLINKFKEAANNSLNNSGSSPLNLACRYTRSGIVIRTLIGLNPTALQQKDKYGNYPIHSAIRGKQSNDTIQHILNVDPLSIQRQNGRGKSPLHMKYPRRLNLILMESMVPYSSILINMRDRFGLTPFLIACCRGMDDVVEHLLQCPGIDVNSESSDDYSTPLHHASYRSHLNIVKTLLDHPCIVFDQKNVNNKTPLDWTKREIKTLQSLCDHGDIDTDGKIKQKLLYCLEIEKLLEDFPVKRRWQAFQYIISSLEEVQSAVEDNNH